MSENYRRTIASPRNCIDDYTLGNHRSKPKVTRLGWSSEIPTPPSSDIATKRIEKPRFCQLRSSQVDHLPQFALEGKALFSSGKVGFFPGFFMVNQSWCHQCCNQATVLYNHFILRPLDMNNRGKYPLSTPWATTLSRQHDSEKSHDCYKPKKQPPVKVLLSKKW